MSDYEEYLKKYARDHKISVEEAESHLIVKIIKRFYEESDNASTV